MKENFIHVCFIVDSSGSMSGSEADIVGGFNKTIEEQKAVKDGQCAVSFFSFDNSVQERFIGKDVKDVKELTASHSIFDNCLYTTTSSSVSITVKNGTADIDVTAKEYTNDPLYVYRPSGMTAMNDGIGTAIDRIGKWLSEMPEEERPSKNLIVIMTDGEENASKEYSLKKVQEMIKHQTEKYNWTFIYMGMDISNAKAADDLGIKGRSFSTKMGSHMYKNYSNISEATTCYRCASVDSIQASAVMDNMLDVSLNAMTKEYENLTGNKVNSNN